MCMKAMSEPGCAQGPPGVSCGQPSAALALQHRIPPTATTGSAVQQESIAAAAEQELPNPLHACADLDALDRSATVATASTVVPLRLGNSIKFKARLGWGDHTICQSQRCLAGSSAHQGSGRALTLSMVLTHTFLVHRKNFTGHIVQGGRQATRITGAHCAVLTRVSSSRQATSLLDAIVRLQGSGRWRRDEGRCVAQRSGGGARAAPPRPRAAGERGWEGCARPAFRAGTHRAPLPVINDVRGVGSRAEMMREKNVGREAGPALVGRGHALDLLESEVGTKCGSPFPSPSACGRPLARDRQTARND